MNNRFGRMPGLRTFFLYHLPLITYAAGIIVLSSIPNLISPKIRFIAFDKLAHAAEYAIFAFLTFRSFSRITAFSGKLLFPIAFLFILLFAALDEYYQSFIPGRHSDPADLVTDVGGALLVLILLAITRNRTAKSEF